LAFLFKLSLTQLNIFNEGRYPAAHARTDDFRIDHRHRNFDFHFAFHLMLKQTAIAIENITEHLVFASRWLQAPVYLGLIVGSGLYVYKFMQELATLAIGVDTYTEVEMMLGILGLIDISMVLNLLIIVIIGGYSIFTSRIDFDEQEDRPQWIDNLDADRLKVKLSTSLASISGVHLLKTFIDIHSETRTGELVALKFELGIHLVFIVSSLVLAWIVTILDNKGEIIRRT
jgi:uncharacterized protein (TIGR00645 family)